MKDVPDFRMWNRRLAVLDLDRCVEFFAEVLGLHVYRSAHDPVDGIVAAHLRRPGATLKLERVRSGTSWHLLSIGKPQDAPQRHEQVLRITTGDLSAFHRKVAEFRVAGLTGIQSRESGLKWFSFHDPEGNLILVEGPPDDIPFIRAIQHSYS